MLIKNCFLICFKHLNKETEIKAKNGFYVGFDSFLLFDINKFMSEEHLRSIPSLQQLGEPPKRRRTPSQYATQIADFKNVVFFLLRTSTLLPKSQRL